MQNAKGLWTPQEAGPHRLSESEQSTKEHTGAVPRPPCTYEADVQLGLHAGSPKLGQELSLKLLPACGFHSPN